MHANFQLFVYDERTGCTKTRHPEDQLLKLKASVDVGSLEVAK
jgi:hypothetical protein